jgi:anti-anti-sigma factor
MTASPFSPRARVSESEVRFRIFPAARRAAPEENWDCCNGFVRVTKPFELRIEHDQGAPRLVVSGELDLASADELESKLNQVESSKPPLLVLDLRELEFMDSTGLRAVIGADARARERGARLVIVRAPEEVDRVFRLTRMDEHLEVVDEPPAA